MSKLYDKFLKLKSENSEIIYLFKSGIFYIALNEDAKLLSDKFGFKITNLNETVTKCGFPNTRLEFYLNLLKNNNIQFKVIDSEYGKVEKISEYLNDEKVKSVIQDIISIDFDAISFKDAYNKLQNISNILKTIKQNNEI